MRHLEKEQGFTLIELLVAMAVLTMLILMFVSLLSAAGGVIGLSRKRLNADSQARVIFDRMAGDLSQMIKRPDVDCVFGTQAGPANDAMFFYSRAAAYTNSGVTSSQRSSTSLVGYRVNTNNSKFPNVPVLERLGKGLSWDGAPGSNIPGGVVFLTTLAGTATPATASTIIGNWTSLGTLAGANNNAFGDGTDTDYNMLGEYVLRLEFAFLLKDGSIADKPVMQPAGIKNNMSATVSPAVTDDSAGGYTVGSRWYDSSASTPYVCTSAAKGAAAWNRNGIKDLSAVIVSMVILDGDSRKIVVSSSQGSPYDGIVKRLPDASAGMALSPPQLMSQTWNAAINAGSMPIPVTAAAQLRVYQRTFSLNQLTQ